MDIQFIGEHTRMLNNYITGYMSKAEKTATKDLWESLDSVGKSMFARLKAFAGKCLQNREMSVVECAIRLLSLPLYGFSDHVLWVNTDMPDKRNRRLKTFKQLQAEPEKHFPYFSNLIDNYYPNRGESMEQVCLYDAAINFNYFASSCRSACNCCYRVMNGKINISKQLL